MSNPSRTQLRGDAPPFQPAVSTNKEPTRLCNILGHMVEVHVRFPSTPPTPGMTFPPPPLRLPPPALLPPQSPSQAHNENWPTVTTRTPDPRLSPFFQFLAGPVRAARVKKYRQATRRTEGMAAQQEEWWERQRRDLDVYEESPRVLCYRLEDEKRIEKERKRRAWFIGGSVGLGVGDGFLHRSANVEVAEEYEKQMKGEGGVEVGMGMGIGEQPMTPEITARPCWVLQSPVDIEEAIEESEPAPLVERLKPRCVTRRSSI